MKSSFLVFLFTVLTIAQAQTRKTVKAVRSTDQIRIDGSLDEGGWSKAVSAMNFTEQSPDNGATISDEFQTEFKVVYSDNSIFFGLKMKDSNPDSILKEMGFRDEYGKNTDWIEIRIYPYDDAQNRFLFNLSAGNIQIDQRNGDTSWNAIWASMVKVTDEGWIAEIEIPFSSLRFPNTDVQSWGLNIVRHRRRVRETSSWQFMNAAIGEEDQQTGILEGVEGLETPIRLSLFPYATIAHDETNTTNPSVIGGLDLKYGLSNSYTLDMTLVPDFGQADFVNEIHNISPFEVRLDENRDFFTEGTELFNKGELFYSRRIANSNLIDPSDELEDDEVVSGEEKKPRLLNAFKLSGRGENGLGTGFFNAVSLENDVQISDSLTGESRDLIINPLTSYSVFVVDKAFRNGSSISMTNTYVGREGSARDAYTYALGGDFYLKKSTYLLSTRWKQSHIFEDDVHESGFNSFVELQKISGKLNYGVFQSTTSETYDINDLGFLDINNKYSIRKWIALRQLTASEKRVNGRVEFNSTLNYIYSPNLFVSWDMNLHANMTTKGFLSQGVNISFRPIEKNNYYEARTGDFEHFFRTGSSMYFQYWVSPDYRKKVAIDANISVYNRSDHGHQSISYRVAPRVRVNNKLSFVWSMRHSFDRNHVGWTTFVTDEGERVSSFSDDVDHIIFAKREVKTFVHELTGQYHLNSKLSFSVRMRHYWRDLRNTSFHELEDGYLRDSYYIGLDEEGNQEHDLAFNSLNADMGCVWRFAPGSEMSLLLRTSYLDTFDYSENNYFRNVNEVLSSDLNNLVSLKILYFLDYKKIRNTFVKS